MKTDGSASSAKWVKKDQAGAARGKFGGLRVRATPARGKEAREPRVGLAQLWEIILKQLKSWYLLPLTKTIMLKTR